MPPARGGSPRAVSRGLSRRKIAGWAEETIVSKTRSFAWLALLVGAGWLSAPLALGEPPKAPSAAAKAPSAPAKAPSSGPQLVAVVEEQNAAEDRKSTRLNSSHLGIS